MFDSIKGLFFSKTFWVNVVVAGGAAFVDAVSAAGLGPDTTAVILGVANIVLRFVTTGSLADKVK